MRNCGLNPIFLFGWSLVVVGAALRVASFRALGVLFTFDVAIRTEHTLITSGPYAYVRHPSYTGIFMIVLGREICQLYEGALIRECLTGAMARWGYGVLVTLQVLHGAFINIGIAARIQKEDGMLRETFGSEWENWSRTVPARLIPFVY